MTWHRKPKLRIASESRGRLAEKIRLALRRGRGQSMQQVIKGLNPVLRGWMAYFRLTEVKKVLEELDGWLRQQAADAAMAAMEACLSASAESDEGWDR